MEKIQTTLVIFLKLFIVFSHIIIYTEFAMSGLELRLVGGSEIRLELRLVGELERLPGRSQTKKGHSTAKAGITQTE